MQAIFSVLVRSCLTYYLHLQFGAGWFSEHMLDCLRQRVKVRFLSVFPQAGAENLLKAASEKFEKLKKGCNKDALKLHEEHQQANTGTTC